MKVLLVSVGSRGDVEPFCALSQALLDGGHQVEYAVQEDLKYLVPNEVNVHTLPFSMTDFYKFMPNPTHGSDSPNPRVRFVGVVADVIGELVLPCWRQVLRVAKECDLIVCSSLARSLSFALTQKLSIPTYLVHLQPLLPTGLFPHYSKTEECVECLTKDPNTLVLESRFLDGYWELERYQYDFLKERVDTMYFEMDLEPLLDFDAMKKILSGNSSLVNIVNAFSNKLVPSTPDAGPYVHDVGALGDAYIPKDFEAPSSDSDLGLFLKNNNPICIGFGSMPYDKKKVKELIEVIKELDQKVLLVGNALKLPDDTSTLDTIEAAWMQEHVRHIDSLPYAWLFPYCSVMVCHGGAGVVHAALRAGIPLVVSPVLGDQFTFAKLLEAKGLGAQAGENMNVMTKEQFKAALEKALGCRDLASSVGKSTCEHDPGALKLAEILTCSSQ
mmetsp:Transcript_19797/g.36959  ORF Transcript_19797/g.36959 Transcript_19797/m.36959 type:complete len:443 (-) Transcript_19797:114-1442(-)